jgi:hypothetical protein
MARIQPIGILEDLSHEVRLALSDAFRETSPLAPPDEFTLWLAFRSAVRSRLRTWEHVSDSNVALETGAQTSPSDSEQNGGEGEMG